MKDDRQEFSLLAFFNLNEFFHLDTCFLFIVVGMPCWKEKTFGAKMKINPNSRVYAVRHPG